MDTYGAPQMHPLLRALAMSFPVGRFFGVQVRIYVVGLIILPLVMFPLAHLHWLDALTKLTYVLGGTLYVLLTIWFHEMGHIWAGRRWHIHTPLITISPLGGLAHMDSAAPHPKGEIAISLAGPATHLVQLAVLWPLSRLVPLDLTAGSLLLHHAVGLNLVFLIFNLLPFYPLDGGRVLRALLAMRMHPNRASLFTAYIGIVGAVAYVVFAAFRPFDFTGALGMGLVVSLAFAGIMMCLRLRQEARYTEGPYPEKREAWQQDPDAWKYGTDGVDEPRPRKRPPPPEPPEEPDPELDRLLDRVRDVGLAGLTERERAALKKASERHRKS
jgi:Zn-dependent protease